MDRENENATPREIPYVWKVAHELLKKALEAGAGTEARERWVVQARHHFEGCGDERLGKLAHVLRAGMSDAEVMVALVPVERVASRAFLADADLGITTEDRAVEGVERLPLIVVADNLRSAFNVGALFRSTDAIGLEGLWLCGYTATPEHPAVKRAALGADSAVPWRTFSNVREAVSELRAQGRRIYALETARDAVSVQCAKVQLPGALLLGSERFGLDPEVVREADAVLRLETYGSKNSLNVGCAFTAAAYAIRWRVENGG